MDATIALCTFCEVHGPKIIFTVQSYRNNDQGLEKLKFYGPKDVLKLKQVDPENRCEGCHTLGNLKFLSNEHETRTSFLSAQQSVMQEIRNLLQQACMRSLSCEVHPGKEGVCYFGDESRGHILSNTFSLKDAQARGLRRLCSFIIFMKDKQFLLNLWPFFVDNLKILINELKDFADKKYVVDESEYPQRLHRLNASLAHLRFQQQQRNLTSITDQKHIFVRIHLRLTWILSAAARHFVEISPNNLLLDNNLNSGSNSRRDSQIPEFCEMLDKNPISILKQLKKEQGKEQFRKLLYSALTGIQILVRGSPSESLEILYALSSLVPKACQRIKPQAQEYLDSRTYNFISVDTSVAVPLPCKDICRLDVLGDEHMATQDSKSRLSIRWTGTLPQKLPTLLIRMENSLDNENLTDSVMRVHLSTLQEEWTNIAKVVHAMHGRGHRGNLSGLMMSLGAGPQDKILLDAWSMGLPSNPA